MASALLLIIVVSITPLFTRSLSSNAAGGRASMMSTFASRDIESLNQAVLNHPNFNLVGQTCESANDPCLDPGLEHWKVTNSADINSGVWIDDGSVVAGDFLLWDRTAKIRKYSAADVQPGDIAIGGGALAPRGHPELYDRPLDDDDGTAAKNVHLLEVRVTIQPHNNLPLSQGQQLTVGQFRVF